MNKLALTLPGTGNIIDSPVQDRFPDLGSVLSGLLNITFYIAVFITFYFFIWGAFAYIVAQGKKEDLAKARNRITWSLIGLIIIFLSYFIARFVAEILKTNIKGGLPF
ncbi:MAG: hypothetical protein PHE48_00345 [Candidatus Daviesbacteria bacterium]|nr:hypothetical protein [Candidatus Daviesbacteria bacterium]